MLVGWRPFLLGWRSSQLGCAHLRNDIPISRQDLSAANGLIHTIREVPRCDRVSESLIDYEHMLFNGSCLCYLSTNSLGATLQVYVLIATERSSYHITISYSQNDINKNLSIYIEQRRFWDRIICSVAGRAREREREKYSGFFLCRP